MIPVEPPSEFVQYSPSFSGPGKSSASCILSHNTAFARHDPDGISGITWSTWDGTTTWNPCVLTKAQLHASLWPTGDCRNMRGLRALYYATNPFADIANPTVAEIDAWHGAVINHYRAMLGVSLTMVNDLRLYLLAQWASERKNTTYWDTLYPTDTCPSGSNTHCGWVFVPSCTDQTPYLPSGQSCIPSAGEQSEGIFPLNNHPWSVRLACMLGDLVLAEGITGHGGPFVNKPNVGFNFWCEGGSTTLRAKFSGTQVNPCT